MEVKDYLDLLRYSDLQKNDYEQIINLCIVKINDTIKNKIKLFVNNEIRKPNYFYLDYIEKIDFLDFIKKITFINTKIEEINKNVCQTILFEYKRNKYKIVRNTDLTENIDNFIKENKINFRNELLIDFFIDLFNMF